MNVSGAAPLSYGHTIRNVNENAGLSYNRQQQLDEMNEKTGMKYDLQKEVSAANARAVVDIFI